MGRELHIARSVAEALCLKESGRAFLAGGTEVLRHEPAVHGDSLIMLNQIAELKGISKAEGHLIRIGAMTTFQEAKESATVPDYLKTALSYMASRTKRNMATIGGNVSLLRDDSCLGAVLIASHAKLEIARKEESRDTVCIRHYMLNRDSYQDSLITAVFVRDDVNVVSKRYANTAESHSYLTVALGLVDGNYRIGISVKNSGVYYAKEASEKLSAEQEVPSEKKFLDWAGSWEGLDIPDDMFGSTAYKRYLLGITLEDLFRKLTVSGKAEGEICGEEA